MKTHLATSALRPRLFSAGLLLLVSTGVSAAASQDRAANLLREHGSIPVIAAGSYVEIGTYRVQVLTRFGRPDATIGADTWVYHRRSVKNSSAVGKLIVRFETGRVASLTLATPRLVAALQQEHAAPIRSVTPSFSGVTQAQ